jgi:carbamoyltransferase
LGKRKDKLVKKQKKKEIRIRQDKEANMTKYVLGIADGHNSTAALLKDGAIIACTHEERYTKIKNDIGYPENAIKYLLDYARITPADLDLVVLNCFNTPPIPHLKTASDAGETKQRKALAREKRTFLRSLRQVHRGTQSFFNALSYRLPGFKFLAPCYSDITAWLGYRFTARDRVGYMAARLGIPREKVQRVEHHLAHAYCAYGLKSSRPALVLTLDGEGDGLCATVNILGEDCKRLSSTSLHHSLGIVYMKVTELLNMKACEDEYKVMGLAPYAKERPVREVANILSKLIYLDKKDSSKFDSAISTRMASYFLQKKLRRYRFDNIAGGVQRLVEKLMSEWVRKIYTVYPQAKDYSLILTGGVFMNIKANKRVMELPEVSNLQVFPSCGDESTAIGACYYGYKLITEDFNPSPLPDLYLGNVYSKQEIKTFIRDRELDRKYQVSRPNNMAREISRLLSEYKIVARLAGRMEWGARALGNRSILANPSRQKTISDINKRIKGRDFWMPFTPTILKEREKDYIVNPKRLAAPYMILAFDSTPLAQKELIACLHPYDLTVRPQILEKNVNPSYYEIIKEFEKLTGIGGVLNTSFNLHGRPLVASLEDALYTFENSDLNYLVLEDHLISKK